VEKYSVSIEFIKGYSKLNEKVYVLNVLILTSTDQ